VDDVFLAISHATACARTCSPAPRSASAGRA
jgi:hypothetical protein